MRFRSSRGIFGPARSAGSSTGVLQHVMVRGIERRALAPVLGSSPQAIYAAAQRGQQAFTRWYAVWKKLT